MSKDAERKTSEYVERRTAMAEQKIAQAEALAVAEVKASAVDIAVDAAEAIIGKKMTGAAAGDVFKQSLAEVKARMN